LKRTAGTQRQVHHFLHEYLLKVKWLRLSRKPKQVFTVLPVDLFLQNVQEGVRGNESVPGDIHPIEQEKIVKHHYIAEITWTSDGSQFLDGKYSRAHRWSFDGGVEVEASASPSVVPLPFSREDTVDPEEAFVAAISSCHMLTFLYLASKQGIDILSYHDRAVGIMEASTGGKLAVTLVTLKPEITFIGEAPPKAVVDALHHDAHEECFIANSIKTEVRIG
jgi:organic hydroperoxide reductase OsmC/OhrA